MPARLLGLVLGAWSLAVGGAIAETADFRQLRLDGHLVRWQKPGSDDLGGTIVLTWRIAGDAMHFPGARNCGRLASPIALLRTSQISQAAFRDELVAAFDMWRAVANIAFIEASPGAEADILVGAQGEPEGWAFTQVFYDGAAPDAVKPITKSLVCLNPVARWKVGFDGNLKAYDLRYTLAHEIGHAIGLDHPSTGGQLMWYRYDESFRQLQRGDVEGASRIYGARLESRKLTEFRGAPVRR